MAPKLSFCLSPKLLPKPKKLGSVVLVDVAFAYGDKYQEVTVPFRAAIDDRLVRWIDHHEHPGWAEVEGDRRFLLRPKPAAPACPELITQKLCAELGEFDDLLAHADFDGCIAAVKILRGGSPPYPEADEDARAIDAPGRGFECSPRGERLAGAIEYARSTLGSGQYRKFLVRVADALVGEREPEALSRTLDEWAEAQAERIQALEHLLVDVEQPLPGVSLLKVDREIPIHERKILVQRLEGMNRVGILAIGDAITVGTYDDTLDITTLPGLEGGGGLAWGRGDLQTLLGKLGELL